MNNFTPTVKYGSGLLMCQHGRDKHAASKQKKKESHLVSVSNLMLLDLMAKFLNCLSNFGIDHFTTQSLKA